MGVPQRDPSRRCFAKVWALNHNAGNNHPAPIGHVFAPDARAPCVGGSERIVIQE